MAFAPPDELLERLCVGQEGDGGDTLYPEVSLACEQIAWWGERLDSSIHLVNDESDVLGRWRDLLLSLTDPATAQRYQITPSTGFHALPLAAMDAAGSRDSSQLQIADIFAGASAEILRTRARGEERSDWVQRLTDAGALEYVGHYVWRVPDLPHTD